VNPWWNYDNLRCWTPRSIGNPTLDPWQIVNDIASIDVDMTEHTVRMIIDCRNETTCLQIDGDYYASCFVKRTEPGYGTDVSGIIKAEVISIDHGNQEAGKRHNVHFRDWTWIWDPATTSRISLPIISKR
jgi:hypothetical protein